MSMTRKDYVELVRHLSSVTNRCCTPKERDMVFATVTSALEKTFPNFDYGTFTAALKKEIAK